jgi:tetratricopeptide (TPR) repeat protein
MSTDFESKRVLVVDDDHGMRSSMRVILSTFGITRSDMAATANEAIRRLQNLPYDIIMCDYFLGDGRDGQQLLEELRHNRLIKLSTVFVMVTAERGYEKVVSAVELAPDDYLIKPFTGEQLRSRLERAILKKEAFAPVYEFMESGDFRAAIAACDAMLKQESKYAIDFIRLKGELCVTVGDFAEAERIYQQVLSSRAIPWARMGLGKALFLQDKFEEAEEIFQEVVTASPQYLEAYDWLADAHAAAGKGNEAQEILAAGAARAPNTLPRQRKLGSIAHRNGDLEAAEKAFSAVVQKGKHSYFRSPDDYVNLGGVLSDKGNFQEALSLMKEARTQFNHSPEASMCAAVMESVIHKKTGNEEEAQASLDEALQWQERYKPAVSNQMKLNMANACFVNGREEVGNEIVGDLIKNNHEDKAVMKLAERMFESIGRGDAGKRLIEASSKEIIRLNNQAVRKAQEGDLEGAIAMLKDAAVKLPGNGQIVLNAAHALLACVDKTGWNAEHMADAKRFLESAKAKDPSNPKLGKLSAYLQEVGKKYGSGKS